MPKNQLRIGAVMSYINMALGALIPMFYTPVMLDILEQSEYGLYKLASTIASYLSLVSFGIGSAVVRYLVKYRATGDRDGGQKMFGLFNIIFSVISVLTLLIGIAMAFCARLFYTQSLDGRQLTELTILIIIMAVNTSVSFLATPYNSVVTCHERFIFLQIISIILTIVPPVTNIVVLMLGFKSIGLVTSTLIITIVSQLVYIFYVRKSIGLKPVYRDMPTNLIKELLLFSFWIFIGTVVNQLYHATDTVIIGAVPALSTIGVAVYNVGATFSGMMQSFTQGINSVLTPKINTMVFHDTDNTELTDTVIRFGRLQCYIVVLIISGFITFGKAFIALWAGADYSDSYWVCLWTMIPMAIPLIQSVAMNIIVAQNKHRFRSLVYLGVAITNVIGTIWCINRFGVIGAAAVSGIASIIGSGFILNWYYWKKIGLEIPRFWKSVAGIFMIPLIMTVAGLIITNFVSFDKWGYLLAGIIIYTIIFAVTNWLFVMNDYEKDIFREPVKKVFGIFKKKRG